MIGGASHPRRGPGRIRRWQRDLPVLLAILLLSGLFTVLLVIAIVRISN
jgi:hypothetical protein